MGKLTSLIFVALSLILSGCQTKEVDELSYSEFKQMALELGKRCEQQGIKSSSPQAKFCIEQELRREISLRRQNKRNAQMTAQAIGAGFKAYADSMASSSASRSLDCTSTRNGNFINTHCY